MALWTTRRGRIDVAPEEARAQSWLSVADPDADRLDGLRADHADLHLEHLDRNLYHIAVTRGPERWGATLSGAGYLKLEPMRLTTPRLHDIHLDIQPTAAQLSSAVARALGVLVDRLRVIDVTDGGTDAVSHDVVAVRARGKGEFALSLSIPSKDPELFVAARLAKILSCRALISDLTVNPYLWILVDDQGAITHVAVDVRALDEDDALTLARPANRALKRTDAVGRFAPSGARRLALVRWPGDPQWTQGYANGSGTSALRRDGRKPLTPRATWTPITISCGAMAGHSTSSAVCRRHCSASMPPLPSRQRAVALSPTGLAASCSTSRATTPAQNRPSVAPSTFAMDTSPGNNLQPCYSGKGAATKRRPFCARAST